VSGVLHVAGADGVSRHEFARLAAPERHDLESGLAAEHPDPRPLDCRLDSSRAQAVLRTRLRGVREVLCA
jgi:dTDP-4-dehydrorhamnose reductase